MRIVRCLALALLLGLPASSFAFGLSLSAGGGYLTEGEAHMKGALELTPFFKASILHFELPIEMQLAPAREFAFGPGLKIFLPDTNAYARASYMLGNLGRELTQSAVVGVGYEREFLDSFGFLVEATGEPRIYPAGGLALMLRAGLFFEL